MKDNSDLVLCTSHDIAPFMYRQFSINKNELTNKNFLNKHKKFKGLT